MANELRTFGDVSRREDVVLNAVEILTAQETQITNMVGRSSAIDLVHNYLTDTLKTAASNAQTEAGDYTNLVRTTPSRTTNLVQHIAIPFRVSRAQQKAEHYHAQNELNRQLQKALKEYANDLEFNVLRQTLTSGLSGTAPKMDGIIAHISAAANNTAHNSGTVWNVTILDGLMKLQYDNSNGEMATDIFMGSFLRNATDAFTQKSNVVVNNPGGQSTIVRTVTTYETAFGTVRFHTHRYIQQSADATGRVLAVRPDKIKLAWFDLPYVDTELSRSGPYTPRAVAGSVTVEVSNKPSNWFTSGLDKD